MLYQEFPQARTSLGTDRIDQCPQDLPRAPVSGTDRSQYSVTRRERDAYARYKRLLYTGLFIAAMGVGLYLLYDEGGYFTKYEYGVEIFVRGGALLTFIGEVLAVFAGYKLWKRGWANVSGRIADAGGDGLGVRPNVAQQ